jgi:hypothetical protein
MTASQKWLLVINVVGGILVLGSYVIGIRAHEAAGDKLWGGTPASIRPWYALSMLLAAAGYLAVLFHLLFRADPASVSLPGGFWSFMVIFALILLPSSLWMSLTFSYAAHPSPLTWWAVRTVLFLAAIGSLALVAALLLIRPVTPTTSWILALIGASAFAFHLTMLDGVLWPVLFRR